MNESMKRGRPNPCRMCSMRVKIRSRSGTVMITDGTQLHRPWYAAHVTPEPLQLSAHTGESFIRSPNSSCWDSLCFLKRPHRCQYCCASLGSHCCFYIKAVVARYTCGKARQANQRKRQSSFVAVLLVCGAVYVCVCLSA